MRTLRMQFATLESIPTRSNSILSGDSRVILMFNLEVKWEVESEFEEVDPELYGM